MQLEWVGAQTPNQQAMKALFAGIIGIVEMDKEKMDERDMIGKRIENIEINGNTVRIDLEDRTHFEFWASDGGYSYQNKRTRWKYRK